MSRRNKESGSSAFVAIAALASIGMAFMFAQESAVRTKGSIDEAKRVRAVEEKNVGAMSALSHYKSLIMPKGIGAAPNTKWIPALFASNYYDQTWDLRQSSQVKADFEQRSSSDTAINLVQPALSDKDLAQLMNNTKSAAKENYTVKFITPNFNDDEKIVKTVDIEVSRRTGGSKTEDLKVLARIPLPPPVPYDAKLMFRKPGAAKWEEMKEGSDLIDGPFEFIAQVSGIAFDGDLIFNEKKLNDGPIFGGRSGDGRVIHMAVNYENVGGEMGPAFKFDPAPEPDPPPVAAPPKKGDTAAEPSGGGVSTTDGTSCGFTKGSYGGGGAGTASAPAEPIPAPPQPAPLPQEGEFRLVVRGPDGTEAKGPGGKDLVKMKVKIRKPPPPPPPVASTGGSGGKDLGGKTLTNADYASVCTAACPYKGEDPGGGILGGYSAFEGQGPVSSGYSRQFAQDNWGIMTQKVCFMYPGAPKEGYSPHDAEVWAYDPATCKGTKLFQRGACGCLTGETKILLGDGKTEKRIDEMNESDTAWNPILKKSFEVRKYTAGPENKPLVQLVVNGQSINATTEHPFLTTLGLKQASAISVGDKIRVGDAWQKVDEVKSIPVPKVAPTVWNLELEGPDDDLDSHYVVANGIVTGDLLIQKKLKKDPQLGSIPGSKLD